MTYNYMWALEGPESSSSQSESCLETETALALGRAGMTARVSAGLHQCHREHQRWQS